MWSESYNFPIIDSIVSVTLWAAQLCIYRILVVLWLHANSCTEGGMIRISSLLYGTCTETGMKASKYVYICCVETCNMQCDYAQKHIWLLLRSYGLGHSHKRNQGTNYVHLQIKEWLLQTKIGTFWSDHLCRPKLDQKPLRSFPLGQKQADKSKLGKWTQFVGLALWKIRWEGRVLLFNA